MCFQMWNGLIGSIGGNADCRLWFSPTAKYHHQGALMSPLQLGRPEVTQMHFEMKNILMCFITMFSTISHYQTTNCSITLILCLQSHVAMLNIYLLSTSEQWHHIMFQDWELSSFVVRKADVTFISIWRHLCAKPLIVSKLFDSQSRFIGQFEWTFFL